MTRNTGEYAVIAEKEYGEDYVRMELIDIVSDPRDARAAAAVHNPDYDATTGCYQCAHGQMAATIAHAYPVVYAGDTCPIDDWTILPADAFEALSALPSAVMDDQLREVMDNQLRDAGYVIMYMDDTYYLVDIRHPL